MDTSLDTTDLERALRAGLPPEHAPQAAALARAMETRRLDPALLPALRALAGREVAGGGALISFGSGSQLGEVSIGDVVGGDKITISLQLPPSQLSPQERRNRRTMIQKVRAIWVDGLLRSSLADAAQRIELGLTTQPDAVELPLNAQYQELRRPPRDLPARTPIIDVFDASGGSLLILGDPGAGKTTLLLELCRNLLERAEQDETQPIPVVFNLSSWAVRRAPLEHWLIEELSAKYDVPRQVGMPWLAHGLLLPLLDGLDEVTAEQRDRCVDAVNVYRQTHLAPIAVCARVGEYEALTKRLRLTDAVRLRALSPAQVEEYLAAASGKTDGLREALAPDGHLRGLAETPLMLGVLALAYQERRIKQVVGSVAGKERQQSLWDIYVATMFTRRVRVSGHTPQQALLWLRRLAQHMARRAQSAFLIEHIHPDWLRGRRGQLLYRALLALAVWLPIATLFGVAGGLPISLGGGRGALPAGVSIGLACGLATWLAVRDTSPRPGGLLIGAAFGLAFGGAFGINFGPAVGGSVGLAIGGVMAGAIVLNGRWQGASAARPGGGIQLVERLSWSWAKAQPGLLIGLCAGAAFGLSLWLAIGHIEHVRSAIAFAAALGVAAGAALGAINGLQSGVVEQTMRPNQGTRNSARNALLVGLPITLVVTPAIGLAFGIGWERLTTRTDVFQMALLIGLSSGLGFGAATALLFGGFACLQHYMLRLLLAIGGAIPLRLVPFLSNSADRALLRRVGGGYIFAHRLLMEHIAAMTDEDIARLSAEIAAGRR